MVFDVFLVFSIFFGSLGERQTTSGNPSTSLSRTRMDTWFPKTAARCEERFLRMIPMILLKMIFYVWLY